MEVNDVIVLSAVREKLESKHGVSDSEVIEVFDNEEEAHVTFVDKGNVEGEDLYRLLGRTDAGRYICLLFIWKTNQDALVISGRDMDRKERKQYAKAKS